jgi:hypothetical protein
MVCSEYVRLQHEYEASLRRWGEAKLSLAAAPQLRLKTYQDRYKARRKLDLHRGSCTTCNDTWETIDRLLENEHVEDDP